MRFTVRGLLVYVLIVSVSFTLTQLPFLLGSGLLALMVTISNFVLPVRTWRFLVYGILAGIIVSFVLLVAYLNIVVTGPRTYTDGRLEVVYAARPYVVQVGALVGATVGFMLSRGKRAGPA